MPLWWPWPGVVVFAVGIAVLFTHPSGPLGPWFLRLFNKYRDLEILAQDLAANLEVASGLAREAEASANASDDKYANVRIDNANLDRERNGLRLDIINLQEANRELIQEKAILEDRLSSALEDKRLLWQQMEDAINGERHALRTMVNHAVQRTAGGIPFPDAHAIPPESIPKPQESGPLGRRGRILPSEMAARQSRQFVTEFTEALEKENARA